MSDKTGNPGASIGGHGGYDVDQAATHYHDVRYRSHLAEVQYCSADVTTAFAEGVAWAKRHEDVAPRQFEAWAHGQVMASLKTVLCEVTTATSMLEDIHGGLQAKPEDERDALDRVNDDLMAECGIKPATATDAEFPSPHAITYGIDLAKPGSDVTHVSLVEYGSLSITVNGVREVYDRARLKRLVEERDMWEKRALSTKADLEELRYRTINKFLFLS